MKLKKKRKMLQNQRQVSDRVENPMSDEVYSKMRKEAKQLIFGYRTQTQFEILTPAQDNLVDIFVLYNLLNLFENLNKLISHLQCFSHHLNKMTI